MFIDFISADKKIKSGEEDILLMEKICNGEENALAELYELYSNLLYAVLLKIIRNREETEDLLQLLFMKIWYKANSFDGSKGNLNSWLITMARNMAIDKIRSKHFRISRYSRIKITDLEEIFNSEETTGLDSLILVERKKVINEALKQIPTEQSIVIELAYYDGLTQSEIAMELNIPLGTIKTRTRQALIKLGKVLNPFNNKKNHIQIN